MKKTIILLFSLFIIFFPTFAQVKYIPVVVHVISPFESTNIYAPDNRVYSAINHLNEAFRKRNPDTVDIIPFFKPIAADAEIEFRLARLDPNGNPTNGINRIQSNLTKNAFDNVKSLISWPRNKYLNIWVVNIPAILGGHTYDLYTVANQTCGEFLDGIVIDEAYFGVDSSSMFNKNLLLVRNLCFYLGLKRPNDVSGTQCLDFDSIPDTPSYFDLPLMHNCDDTIASCEPNKPINLQNFHVFSLCGKMFTQGQKQWMHQKLALSSAERNNLWTINNLLATGIYNSTLISNYQEGIDAANIPFSDFYHNFQMIGIGDSIQFTAKQSNADATQNPDTYFWEFEGGQPSVSNQKNPMVKYFVPGEFKVKLTVTNSNGSNSKEKDNCIYVSDTIAQFEGLFSDNFETSTDFSNNWIVKNLENDSSVWDFNNQNSFAGNACLKLNNFKYQELNACFEQANIGIDELISPSIDLSKCDYMQLYFNYANALFSNDPESAGSLGIYISINNGKTWNQIGFANLNSTNLFSTAPYNNTQSSHWRESEIFISKIEYGRPNVRFKFKFKSEKKGNNIYLDNFRITGEVASAKFQNYRSTISIFPNPAYDFITIENKANQNGNYTYSIFDYQGKKIKDGNLTFSNSTENISIQEFNSGIYFIRIENEKGVSVEKFVKL